MQVICVLLCRSRSIIHTGRLVMAFLWKQKRKEIEKISKDNNRSAPYNCGLFDFQAISFLFFIPVCQCIQWGVDNQRKKEEEENTQNNSK